MKNAYDFLLTYVPLVKYSITLRVENHIFTFNSMYVWENMMSKLSLSFVLSIC